MKKAKNCWVVNPTDTGTRLGILLDFSPNRTVSIVTKNCEPTYTVQGCQIKIWRVEEHIDIHLIA